MAAKPDPWQILANLNDLVFTPGRFPNKPRVVGQYQGYRLRLSRWRFGLEIILSADCAHRPGLPFPIRQLLYDINADTSRRLAGQADSLLCARCIVRCHPHKVEVPGLLEQFSPTYYGCRRCHQSREFIKSSEVIAVLDDAMKTKQSQTDAILRVNWLIRRLMFDFDRVEIMHATDEDVERFVVQFNNNRSSTPKTDHQKIPCTVAPNSRLTENTLRILRHTFNVFFSEKRSPTPIEVHNDRPN